MEAPLQSIFDPSDLERFTVISANREWDENEGDLPLCNASTFSRDDELNLRCNLFDEDSALSSSGIARFQRSRLDFI